MGYILESMLLKLFVLVFSQIVVLLKQGASRQLKSSLKLKIFSMYEGLLLTISITKNCRFHCEFVLK